MKLHRLNRDSSKDGSFTVTNNKLSNFLKVWHYHPELELVYTVKSSGTRFVGDSIKKFEEGDVVLIGKNLPHMWLNEDAYFEKENNLLAEDIVVHFSKEFLGYDIMQVEEMKPIYNLLDNAGKGIKFLGLDSKGLKLLREMTKLKAGLERTLLFIQLLHILASHNDVEVLSSSVYTTTFKKRQSAIMDKTFEFVFENFANTISLKDVAAVAEMNPSAFSRFFKRINKKTFSRYLNEVRIGYACRLLLERQSNITAICYESGFNNVSNFNRQFKIIMNISPSEYRSRFIST